MTDLFLIALTGSTLFALARAWPHLSGEQPGSNTSTPWALVGPGLVVLLGGAHQLLFRTIAEDAFITFRYARNLAEGYGPVFNPGERVEGYSDFLWMVILAALRAISGLDMPLLGRVLGVLAALAAIVLTWRFSLRLTGGNRLLSLVAALFVASSGAFVAHGPGGLETSFFTLLVLATLLLAARGMWTWAGVLAALTTMTRPEGVLLMAVLAGYAWLSSGPEGRGGRLLRVVVSSALLVLPWNAWRVWYYGYLIPNAMQAKRGVETTHQVKIGLLNAAEFLLANPPILIVVVVVVVALARRSLAWPPAGGVLAAWIGAHMAFAIYAGGDWMPAWRYLAPIIPLSYVLLVGFWHHNTARVRFDVARQPLVVLLFAGLLVVESLFHPRMIPQARLLSAQVDGLSAIGRWLRDTLPAGTAIATYANGSLSYYAGREIYVLDMLGLTDEHIAREGHRKRDGFPWNSAYDHEYVISREPAVISFSGGGLSPDPSCKVREPFSRAYAGASFRFSGEDTPLGSYANVLLRQSDQAALREMLGSVPGVEAFPCPR